MPLGFFNPYHAGISKRLCSLDSQNLATQLINHLPQDGGAACFWAACFSGSLLSKVIQDSFFSKLAALPFLDVWYRPFDRLLL